MLRNCELLGLPAIRQGFIFLLRSCLAGKVADGTRVRQARCRFDRQVPAWDNLMEGYSTQPKTPTTCRVSSPVILLSFCGGSGDLGRAIVMKMKMEAPFCLLMGREQHCSPQSWSPVQCPHR